MSRVSRIKSDASWVAYAIEPESLRNLRRGMSARFGRFLRGPRSAPVEGEPGTASRGREGLPTFSGAGTTGTTARTYLTAAVAMPTSHRRAKTWQCPTAHASLSSSVALESVICHCGRSMIEIPGNRAVQ